jgi:hypothetical protein
MVGADRWACPACASCLAVSAPMPEAPVIRYVFAICARRVSRCALTRLEQGSDGDQRVVRISAIKLQGMSTPAWVWPVADTTIIRRK